MKPTLINFNKDPVVFYEDAKIKVIYFNDWGISYMYDNVNDWNKLKELLKRLYIFNIEERADILRAERNQPEIKVLYKPKKFIWNRR
jgi:hypothetical protein